MRLLIGVLSVGITCGACGRAETSAAASASAERPASASASTAAAAPAESSPATPSARPGDAARGVREITIPAGTRLPITLDTTVGSATSRVEQPVRAHLTRPLVIDGRTVLPAGSPVGGVVTDATRSGKVKGRAHVSVRFDSLTAHDIRYPIETSAVGRTAEATKKKDALEIGAPAAGGAIIGAIAGGKKGAAIGTAIGGGGGTAVVLSTRGKEVSLPKGSALTLRLSQPLTVKIGG